jgi:hypothetical protein
MTDDHAWRILFQAEINHAENARSEGNEGMARVCARRAVGIVFGEYFRRNDLPLESPSAYDRLRFMERMPNISDDLLTKIQHFLVRVNSDYTLPIDADLINEAQQIKIILLGSEQY